MKFSQKFYPDVISVETPTGEKTYYDVAYQKGANDHVLGLLSVGTSTEEYYQLANSQAIVDAVLAELDGIYDGAASQSYTGEFIMKNWGQEINTLSTTTKLHSNTMTKLNPAGLSYLKFSNVGTATFTKERCSI